MDFLQEDNEFSPLDGMGWNPLDSIKSLFSSDKKKAKTTPLTTAEKAAKKGLTVTPTPDILQKYSSYWPWLALGGISLLVFTILMTTDRD